jgi:hypothetical protein
VRTCGSGQLAPGGRLRARTARVPSSGVPSSGAPQVIISAVLGRRSFLGGTARLEARSRHNGQKGPEWDTLPESKQHTQQIREVLRRRRQWKELRLPWVSGGLVANVNHVQIGFGETIAFAPLALFGHLKTGGGLGKG